MRGWAGKGLEELKRFRADVAHNELSGPGVVLEAVAALGGERRS